MSGNSTSLYSTSTSNITLSSNNLTTLYPGGSGTVTPAQPYGNANVVGLLAAGTDGANTVSNIIATGNVTANYFLGNGSQLTGITSSYGNANVTTLLAAFGSNTISTTGNITGGFILGNGSQLSGLPATYSNANVTSLLANFGSNSISTTGNVTAGYVVGNGSLLTSITGANVTGSVAQANQANTANAVAGANVSGQVANALVAGTVYTNAQPNITSLGTLTSVVASGNITGGNLFTAGVVSATGNITTSGFFIGNFQGNITGNLTVPGANTEVIYNNSGNAGASSGFTFNQSSNVVTVAGNIVGGNISTTGNVTANYVIGNGALLSDITGGNVTGSVAQANLANTANAVAGANVSGQVANALVAGTVYTAAQPNITSVGILTSASVTGNVTGGLFTGNGAGLTSLTGANVTGTVANATYALNANAATYANIVTDAAQPNITSVGTLTSLSTSGNITATGNIQGNVFTGNGAGLTNINAGNIVGAYGNANVANFLGSYGSNTLSTTGNVTTGNLNVQLDAVITGNLTVNGNTTLVNSNVVTINDKFINVANNASTAAQANGGGLGVGPVGGEYATLTYNSTNNDWNTNIALSVNGNVTGSNFVGNGQYLSSITGANVTGSVAQANQANIANSVSGSNVSGQVANALVAGTVYTNAQPNITSVGTLTSVAVTGNTTTGNLLTGGLVSATGNITGNYIIGNGSQLTGLPAGYSNADVATFLASFGSNSISTTGNITAGYFTGNGSLLTSITGGNVTGVVANATYALNSNAATFAGTVTTAAQPNITSVGILTAVNTSGNISATGNITGSYFLGNGSQLTDLPVQPGTYGNANVVANLAALGSNPVSTTGNVTASYLIGNGSLLSNITGANVTGTVANATFATSAGTAGSATTAATVTDAAQPNITSVGILTAINTSGAISATGNIQGNVFIGNGAGLTNIPAGNIIGAYGNANVAANLAAFANNPISTTGNVTASYFIGNGSLLSNITGGNVTGTVANATFATSAGSAATANTVTDAAQPNITSVGILTSINTSGAISATGNIQGNVFIGNGAGLTNIPGGNIVGGYSNADVSNFLANGFGSNTITTTGNVTSGNLLTSGVISATGNIQGGNLSTGGRASITGNITAANLLFYTANSNTANFVGTGSTITTSVNASNVNVASFGVNPYRWTVGTGFNGDYTANADPLTLNRGSQLAIIGTQNLTNSDILASTKLFSSTLFIDLQANNVTSTAKRYGSIQAYTQVGNGNITLSIATGTNPAAVLSGMASAVLIGNQSFANLGNAVVSHVAAQNGAILAAAGGTIGNAAAVTATVQTQATTGTFTTSQIGYMAQFQGTVGTVSGNVIGYYMPSNVVTYGWNSTNLNRASANYYFLRNDDAVAQNQLGSLRAYHEFQATGTTTGTWNIDKNNGQVQRVSATGNITIGSYTNFVTTANDSVNNDNQTDTVTLIIEQGSTPYTVTMPTGNAAIRYASNVTTVSNVANTTTMIAVTAFRTTANATGYLTTISPGFV